MDTMVSNIIELSIKGMTCSVCTDAVGRALRRVPGVTEVAVELDPGRVRISGTAPQKDLVAAVETAGFDIMARRDVAAPASAKRGGCCCG